MTFTILDAATAAARAAEAHINTGCTTCRPGARLAELCEDGQHAVLTAVEPVAPALLKPEPPTTPATAPAMRADQAPTGPARLAALMRSRQHWDGHRLVSEGTLSQTEIRAALGWIEPPDAPAATFEPGRLDQLRDLVHVITAGPSASPDCTDLFMVQQARTVMPELLALVERLAARVEELQARGCSCYAPTSHAPGCIKAATRFKGRPYPAAVWYRDQDGDWWLPVSVDSRGCLVLQLDGDAGQGPAPLDDLEAAYGRLTATVYGAHIERRDLPEGTGADAARSAVRLHVESCWTCRADHGLPKLCTTGQELTLGAASAAVQAAHPAAPQHPGTNR